MSFQKEEKLCFFDNGVRYPYLRRHCRRETKTLPVALQELRTSTGNNFKASNKLDEFLQKQKRIPFLADFPLNLLKKKAENANLDTIKESARLTTKKKKQKQNKKNKKIFFSDVEETHESEEEDDVKFLFEETKFSATTIISQLGKLLDVIVDNNAEEREVKPPPQDLIVNKNGSTDIIWRFKDGSSTTEPIVARKTTKFVPSEAIVDLLSIDYNDLIKNTQYKDREWQTHTYRHIVGSSVKPTDSGIFSTPPTAMSGLYTKSKENLVKNKRTTQLTDNSASNVLLQQKPSYDSGLTSDADSMYHGHENGRLSKKAMKQRTRLEKYAGIDVVKDNPGEDSEVVCKKKQEKEDDKINEVSTPPLTQPMINFAISSRICHEKGWIVQPSFLQDPEHRTLLLWARERLQEAVKQRLDEEEEFRKKNLKVVEVRYYGDTKRNIAIKYKHGTAIAKQMMENKDIKPLVFMITLPDGSYVIFYPSGNIAVSAVTCHDNDGSYILVYPDDANDKRLLAYFTPSGRGVCYHKNGRPAFASMAKFGCCQDESGALINKWKWTVYKMVPPLAFQINPKISFRCANKHSMVLLVNINGESLKVNIGSKTEILDPNLTEMGSLLTMENFSSNIAIQLSKTIPKKKEATRKGRYQIKPSKVNKKADTATSATTIPEGVLEQRMKDLQLKFPEERQEVEMSTPYQLELKTLQRKFKTTISDWLDHYRIATGMTSPGKSVKRSGRKSQTVSAVSLPTKMPSSTTTAKQQQQDCYKTKTQQKKLRTPSAPPMSHGNKMRISFDAKLRPHSSTCYGTKPKNVDFVEQNGRRSPIGGIPSTHSSLPFKCGLLQVKSKPTIILPKDGCPIALRKEMFGQTNIQCRCDSRKVPLLTDIELDRFLEEIPKTQLVVISLVNNGTSATKNSADRILEKLYRQLNKNRSIPCVQSRHDPYRLFRYVIPTHSIPQNKPLLAARHNVVPGMFMMYQGRKLLFADYIFDGYGNTKKDFLRQISRTRKEALKGRYLPEDFQFSPSSAGVIDKPSLHQTTAVTASRIAEIAKRSVVEKQEVTATVQINIFGSEELTVPLVDSRPSGIFVDPQQQQQERQKSFVKDKKQLKGSSNRLIAVPK